MEEVEKKYIVDRVEEEFVLCENENKFIEKIERKKLPKDIKEKDIVILKSTGEYVIDENETKKRKQYISDLFNSL